MMLGARGGAVDAPDQNEHPARIPTRLVTSKKGQSAQSDNVDMASFRSTPELFQKNVNLVRTYPNMRLVDASQPTDRVAEHFINHMVDNLLDLHDRVPVAVRQRSKLWYKGARNIIDHWSKEYGLPDHSIAGAIAALSPQKDWFQNVSLAKRVLDAMHGGGRNFYAGFAMTPAMEKQFRSRDALNKPVYEPLLAAINGKTLHELDQMEGTPKEKAARKALWIRLHDETYNPSSYPLITPEGGTGKTVRTKSGEERAAGWGSLTEIGKAIQAIEALHNPERLSELMGEKHKVRNFYNNMLSPDSRYGDVTIDTHAVAAALMRALSGNSLEVAHNFANHPGADLPAAGGSALSGIQGTYPLYAEAYRRAARQRNILPREMQSITWEAIRSMMSDDFKRNANNVRTIDNIWNLYRHGRISQKQAREQVYAYTGGVRNPDWFSGDDEAAQHPVDQGELSRSGVSRPSTATPIGGGGGRPARYVPTPKARTRQGLTEPEPGSVDRALALVRSQP